jgi:hypothetical protein
VKITHCSPFLSAKPSLAQCRKHDQYAVLDPMFLWRSASIYS